MLKRVFWSLNCVIAGLFIGWGLFLTIHTGDKILGATYILFGVSHVVVSVWGYRKFVGRGLFFVK